MPQKNPILSPNLLFYTSFDNFFELFLENVHYGIFFLYTLVL